MSRFLDERYQELQPYTPGEQPQTKNLIKLNTNECPYGTSPKVLEAVQGEDAYRLYPDPACSLAVSAVANYYGLSDEQVLLGNGSDELLAFAFMAYGRKVAYPEISYGFYPVFAELFGCENEEIPLRKDFSIAPADYMDFPGTVVIANPNAPTGMALSSFQIEHLMENPDRVVIVDEAYVDFGAESCVSLIEKYDNLLVVQTMSKSRALAGMRIGMAMGSKALIDDLNRIKFSFNPYNLSREAILAAKAAMEDEAYFRKTTEKIVETRTWFVTALRELGVPVLPSKANFVFAKTGEAAYEKLRARGILVRHFDKERICDYVRITIGTTAQMAALLDALKDILAEERAGAGA